MNSHTLVFIESGRKRKGEEAVCKNCTKIFVRRFNSSPATPKKLYCSTECSHIGQSLSVEKQCSACEKTVMRAPSRIKVSKSGTFFCSKECLGKALGGDVDAGDFKKPAHFGMGNQYRRIAEREKERQCVDCGITFSALLAVHHIDGNRSNNDVSNLEFLCLNHHAIRHLKFKEIKDGEGLGEEEKYVMDTKFLTPREKLKEINQIIEMSKSQK